MPFKLGLIIQHVAACAPILRPYVLYLNISIKNHADANAPRSVVKMDGFKTRSNVIVFLCQNVLLLLLLVQGTKLGIQMLVNALEYAIGLVLD